MEDGPEELPTSGVKKRFVGEGVGCYQAPLKRDSGEVGEGFSGRRWEEGLGETNVTGSVVTETQRRQ